jgi:nickel/cobalt transporter (NiCoT) family protein
VSSRWARLRQGLTPREWGRVAGLAAVVLGLHLVGFAILLSTGAFGLGIGITAYTLGLRHAFDADHIAAIDNTTRKLMSEGQRPLSVGFYFSLGHSSVVFGLALLLALGFRAVGDQVADGGSGLQQATSLIGTSISGAFLVLIAIVNLVVLVGIIRVFRRMRGGELDEAELEAKLASRGALYRVFGRFTGAVTKPWHMYPVGLLFGLGFDTATEVALLVLAAGAGASGLPFYAILCLPILFAAGMSLLDTIDGAFMNFAYGWALAQPVRKVFYNITITALSVAVALLIGTAELLSIAVDELGLRGGAWDAVAGLDLNLLGYAVVGLFVLTWLGALAVWRFGRIEERWSAGAR